jgi:hypothetical protein
LGASGSIREHRCTNSATFQTKQSRKKSPAISSCPSLICFSNQPMRIIPPLAPQSPQINSRTLSDNTVGRGELAHQHGEAAVADERYALPVGIGELVRNSIWQAVSHSRERARERIHLAASGRHLAREPGGDCARIRGDNCRAILCRPCCKGLSLARRPCREAL